MAKERKAVKATIRNKDGDVVDRISVPNPAVYAAASSDELGNARMKKRSSKKREGRDLDGPNGSKTAESGSTADVTELKKSLDLPAERKSGRGRSRSKIAGTNKAGTNSAAEVEARFKVRRKRKLPEGRRISPAEKKSKVSRLVEDEEDCPLKNDMKDRKSKSGVYLPPHARKSIEQAGCCDEEDREFHEAVKQQKKQKEMTEQAASTEEQVQKQQSPSDPDNAPISKDRNKGSQVTVKKKANVVKANKTTQSLWRQRQSRQETGTDDYYGSSVQPMPTTPQSSNGWNEVQNEGSANRLEAPNLTPNQQRNTTFGSEDSNGFRGTAQNKVIASNGQSKRHQAPSQLIHPEMVEKLFAAAEGERWIDSHCHLDFIWEQKRDDFDTWMKKYPIFFPPTFEGCIPNFIYPELFTRIDSMIKKFDRGWIEKQVQSAFVYGATYGCHPHKADLYSDDVHDELFKFCRDKKKYKTIAIGECGLDYYRNKSSKENQKDAFCRQLKLARDHNLTVVIHCRPAQPDDETEDECLEILQKNVSHYHNIHRHCFPGSKRTAEKWVEQFPNTYFGFTYLIETASDAQKEAIRAISIDRILIETDAPFFKPRAFYQEDSDKTSFPGMAIAAAEVIARYKGLSLAEVLRATRRNVDRCYGLPVL